MGDQISDQGQSTLRHRPQPQTSKSSQATKPPTRDSLLSWSDLPSWRRDNHFIQGGYRTHRPSTLHTILSLTHLHNESVNIWSHLLGAVTAILISAYLYLVIHPRYESATKADVAVFGCFFAGAVLCLGMSATFHALLSHSDGAAKWGNKLDYSGIVLLIVGSNVPAMYYGFFCEVKLMRFYLGLVCNPLLFPTLVLTVTQILTLGTGCALASWLDRFRTPELRPYRALMFISLGLSGIVPVVHGISIYGYSGLEDRMSVSWVIFQGALYIFGAVLYAARFPERTAPGTFDIWGSSHQLFHGFVVLAAAAHLWGMSKAFDYHHTGLGWHCMLD